MTETSRRVLVHAAGELGDRLAGPEIRALQLARALSGEYEVTLAAGRSTAGERDGFRIVPSSRRRLLREAASHDAIVSACLPPYLLASRRLHRLATVADQYDPREQEIAALPAGRARERELRARGAIQALQLRCADAVLCASNSQRAELLRVASALGQAGAQALDPVVVPLALPRAPPPSGRRPLREHFPQIAHGDTVVLWWGTVWRWLDAETAIRALACIALTRPDVKLVITAGRPPGKTADRRFDATEQVRALAAELGVLGRTVLFLDMWVSYEQRHDYLRDADIGLTLHRDADEARLAARARYMDYLAVALPCVLGRGDETAEELADGGFATLLEEPDPGALAAALLALADSPQMRARAHAAGRQLAAARGWSSVSARLRQAVASAIARRDSPQPASPALLGASAFYARRVADVTVSARPWRARRSPQVRTLRSTR